MKHTEHRIKNVEGEAVDYQNTLTTRIKIPGVFFSPHEVVSPELIWAL